MILLGPVLTVMVCAFAIWRGGAAERATGVFVLGVQAVSIAAQLVAGVTSPWPIVACDLLLGIGLVALCFLHARAWLYVAISLCASLLLVHSFLLEEGAAITPLYRALVDGLNLAFLATLTTATIASARRPRPSAR